ncbi:hypothetical protein FRC02_009986 [Tulasnella sp. 418]|nr:hypothetical protein FRC02_009986 [Tulasnella sp. 418]
MSVYRPVRRILARPASLRLTGSNVNKCISRSNSSSPAAAKYANKLQARLQEEGASSVKELRERLKSAGKEFKEPVSSVSPFLDQQQQSNAKQHSRPSSEAKRKDSSPVKPLSSFLNVQEILKKQNTVEQINALWTLYHASKSGGTGRGYVSATLPLDTYNQMMKRAKQYPMFIVPIPKPDSVGEATESNESPVEFHVLQWNFHEAPPIPSSVSELDSFPHPPPPASTKPNPPIATVIFTPLIQYKLHQSYAPPYMVLTFYTDLVSSRDLVLLRGEITPSSTVSSGSEGSFMLSQQDAQLLAMGLQQFYLPASGSEKAIARSQEAEELLKTFHEKPAEFDWKALMRFTESGLLN